MANTAQQGSKKADPKTDAEARRTSLVAVWARDVDGKLFSTWIRGTEPGRG